MIAFLADAAPEMGMGHVYRCLSIARQIKEISDKRVCFICASGKEQISEAGFEVIERRGGVDNVDTADILNIIEKNGIECLISDSYLPDGEYYEKVDSAAKSVRIFDIGDPTYPCDTLIDYNLDNEDYDFINARRRLLGAKYAPLRAEFMNLPAKRVSEKVEKVLITAGGSDPINATDRILSELLSSSEFDDIKFTVIAGAMNRYFDKITKTAKRHKERVEVLRSVNNMAELFTEADIVLTAGGSTLFEVCACGVPAVVFSVADNQDPMIAKAQSLGLMFSAGCLWREGESVENVARNLLRLKNDKSLREEQSRKMRAAVDGLGAQRIARSVAE